MNTTKKAALLAQGWVQLIARGIVAMEEGVCKFSVEPERRSIPRHLYEDRFGLCTAHRQIQ